MSTFGLRRSPKPLSSCDEIRLGMNLSPYTTDLRVGLENLLGGEARDVGEEIITKPELHFTTTLDTVR
jgi:hypothetical protein